MMAGIMARARAGSGTSAGPRPAGHTARQQPAVTPAAPPAASHQIRLPRIPGLLLPKDRARTGGPRHCLRRPRSQPVSASNQDAPAGQANR